MEHLLIDEIVTVSKTLTCASFVLYAEEDIGMALVTSIANSKTSLPSKFWTSLFRAALQENQMFGARPERIQEVYEGLARRGFPFPEEATRLKDENRWIDENRKVQWMNEDVKNQYRNLYNEWVESFASEAESNPRGEVALYLTSIGLPWLEQSTFGIIDEVIYYAKEKAVLEYARLMIENDPDDDRNIKLWHDLFLDPPGTSQPLRNGMMTEEEILNIFSNARLSINEEDLIRGVRSAFSLRGSVRNAVQLLLDAAGVKPQQIGAMAAERVRELGGSVESISSLPNPEKTASSSSLLYRQLLALRSEIARQVQMLYDEWEQDEEGIDEVYGSGGICDEISETISSIIVSNIDDVEVTEGGQEGDDHAFTIAYRNDKAFIIDVPPSVYESGSGYVWKKRHDVNFNIDDIEVYDISGDFSPEDYA